MGDFAAHFEAWRGFCSQRGISQGVSQPISQLQNGVGGCEMALACQGGVSQGVRLGLRNDFAAEGFFHSETLISHRGVLGCEIISQQMAIFARTYFGLRNFVNH